MNIEVITAWYNEEILAPYFLKHYSFADRIHILLDDLKNAETLLQKTAKMMSESYVLPPYKSNYHLCHALLNLSRLQKINQDKVKTKYFNTNKKLALQSVCV